MRLQTWFYERDNGIAVLKRSSTEAIANSIEGMIQTKEAYMCFY